MKLFNTNDSADTHNPGPRNSDSARFSTTKILLATGIFVIGVLAISLIALLVRNNNQDIDPHADIVLDTTPYAFFENHYILEQNLTPEAYQSVRADLQSVILDPAELASAPSDNDPSAFSLPAHAYDALIDPASFTRHTDTDYKDLSFTMAISDGRVYTVALRVYGLYENYYYGLIAYRVDDDIAAHSFITFLLPGDSDPDSRADFTYDRDAAIAGLTSWFSTFPASTVTSIR